MTKSAIAATSKIKNIGTAVCNICCVKKVDVVRVKKNWFTTINICDGCGQQVFKRYRKGFSGDAK